MKTTFIFFVLIVLSFVGINEVCAQTSAANPHFLQRISVRHNHMLIFSAQQEVSPNTAFEYETPREIQIVTPMWRMVVLSYTQNNSSLSNRRLANHITQFYNSHLVNNQRVYQGWNISLGYAIDRELSTAFREVLIQGFKQDSFAQVKPFDVAFFEEVLNNVQFYFARPRADQRCGGRYNPNLGHTSHIWIATGRNTQSAFARTAIHEMGHAFGLGETLADLNMEMFLGLNSSIRLRHNLAYNSTFDRILLEAVGANRFWAAAYSSNAAYGALWDETFGCIITHAELELVRGVVLSSLVNSQTRVRFLAATGVSVEAASVEIFEDLVLLLNRRGDIPAQVAASYRLNSWVDFYVAVAVQYNIAASHSVFDWVMQNHHVRFVM